MFIAFHGSWNRSVPAGYKVVRVILNSEGEIQSHDDFITGWLRPDGVKSGRPVDVEKSPNGNIYVSDEPEQFQKQTAKYLGQSISNVEKIVLK